MPLERLQSDFAAALTDPLHAAAVVGALDPSDGRASERLALYRGNVVAAREKALANAFPVVRALVGAEFFSGLARAYGQAHPSRSGDLNRFGEHFPAFVRDFEHTQTLPYLGDVAALEWAVHTAHYAADAAPLPREAIAALPADQLLAARFSVHPACAWIVSAYPVAGIWLAHQPGSTQALPETLDRREWALVTRPRWRVEVLASSAGEIAALAQVQSGADMECAIGAALSAEPEFNFARALVRWLDQSILVA
jgi:hypothetical protein